MTGDGSAWAIIENPATNAQRLYRLNQVVAGMARLARIEQDRIECRVKSLLGCMLYFPNPRAARRLQRRVNGPADNIAFLSTAVKARNILSRRHLF